METFSAILALCAGNSPVTDEFPHEGQWRRALMFSLISAWIRGEVNNHEAGDLRCHRAHYDVIVMIISTLVAQLLAGDGYYEIHLAVNGMQTLTNEIDKVFVVSFVISGAYYGGFTTLVILYCGLSSPMFISFRVI